jgi:hypothetical protein
VVTLFGKPKLWPIWPPTEENLCVLKNLYGQGNKVLRCYKQLQGGVFVVQKDLQTLLVPPYNPHATFSIGGSIICGYEFEAVEIFPAQISHLHVEIEFLDNQHSDENDRGREHNSHLDTWVNGLEHTLKEGDDATKEKVIKAWITSMSTVKAAFRRTKGYEARVCAIWGEFLKTTKIKQCPCCSHDYLPFETHMMSKHVEIVCLQRTKGKKRGRDN